MAGSIVVGDIKNHCTVPRSLEALERWMHQHEEECGGQFAIFWSSPELSDPVPAVGRRPGTPGP